MPYTMRSLLNVALLMALNCPYELKLHIRSALRNGCKRDEGREVLLQAAVYCGVPAAVDAFRSAKEAFAGARRDKHGQPGDLKRRTGIRDVVASH